jgi:hypothetical protein
MTTVFGSKSQWSFVPTKEGATFRLPDCALDKEAQVIELQ